MNNILNFFISLTVMAGVTYLIRLLPLLLCKKKIQNVFLQSFLYYIPYAVLGAMTIPAIFYATGSTPTAIAGFVTAVILAWFEKSLLVVAAASAAVVCLTELLLHSLTAL